MKRTLIAIAISGPLLVAAMTLGACSASQKSPSTSATPSTTGGTPTSQAPVTTEPPAKPAATFIMPNLVGRILQDAQDLLQSKGSYSMRQEDATGLGRINVLDTNWRVCRQSPKAGTRVSVDDTVTVWSVKIDPPEKCPAG